MAVIHQYYLRKVLLYVFFAGFVGQPANKDFAVIRSAAHRAHLVTTNGEEKLPENGMRQSYETENRRK